MDVQVFTLSRADETVISRWTWNTWVFRQHIFRCCVSELGDTTKPAAAAFVAEAQMDRSKRNTRKTAQQKRHLKQ